MTSSLFFMVREITFLMRILISYHVGSDSLLSDTSCRSQDKNLNVLGGSGETFYLGTHSCFLFLSVIFSGCEFQGYSSQRNHAETWQGQWGLLLISYLNCMLNGRQVSWIIAHAHHLIQFLTLPTPLTLGSCPSYFHAYNINPIQFQCNKYLEWTFSKIWIFPTLC